MFARVVTLQFQAGKDDDAVHLFQNFILPAVKQQQGFKGAYVMTDESNEKGLGITLWDSEADLLATETSESFLEQIAKLGQVVSAPPTRENFEVNLQA